MNRRLLVLALWGISVGLLGSCSKISEKLDNIDKRIDGIENNKIASIEQQISSISASIADLEIIRTSIQTLVYATTSQGEEITALKAADNALEGIIAELKAYIGDLSRYAEKDWATATFATLEELNSTKMELCTLKEKVDKLGDTFDDKLKELNTNLSNSINNAIIGINASISAIEARVCALEQMIQTVSIIPAYNDGSVKAENAILTIACVITPKEAVNSLKKENFTILISEVLTKAGLYRTLPVVGEDDLVIDKTDGTATIMVDISSLLPVEEGKALSVALNVKNGISDFTTEFAGVTLTTTPYVMIAGLKWYRQNLAISASGNKSWKGGNTSAVKVPGTDEDVKVGDFFQWGAYAGYCGNVGDTDKGLLVYTAFNSINCVGDAGSDGFTLKSAGEGKAYRFNISSSDTGVGIAPYFSGSDYTKYTSGSVHLELSDDVANIILGGTWRLPTRDEFWAMKNATYWEWDETDRGYYVFEPNSEADSGKENTSDTGAYNKSDAILFFPAVGLGSNRTPALYESGSNGYYWSSVPSGSSKAYGLRFSPGGHPTTQYNSRYFGFSVRPVSE